MRKNAFARHGKRAADRLRAIRRRAAAWKRRARQALALALITAGTASAPSIASAQMGQVGMAPATGLGNRAAAALKPDVGLNHQFGFRLPPEGASTRQAGVLPWIW